MANVVFETPVANARARLGRSVCPQPPAEILYSAARSALAAAPSKQVDHASLHRALVRNYRTLRTLGSDRRRRLADDGSEHVRESLALTDHMAALLDGYDDDADVLWQGVERMASDAGAVATIIVVTQRLDAAEAAYLQTLVEGGAVALVAVADVEDATGFIDALDPAAEVSGVLRRVARLMRKGVPPERIGLVYPGTGPYRRMLGESLEARRWPWSAPPDRTLASSASGRVLARLLAFVSGQVTALERDAVVDLLSTAPSLLTSLSASRIDEISRRAGVLAGIDDWNDKLDARRFALAQTTSADRSVDLGDGERAALRREIDDIDAIGGIVELIADLTDPASIPQSWSSRSRWVRDRLAALVGSPHPGDGWPENEIESHRRIDAALARLASNDAIEPFASQDAFVFAIEAILAAPAPAKGTAGRGITVVPIAAAAALDVDAVFVLGCNDGMLPAPTGEHALFEERDRELVGEDVLEGRREQVAAQRQAFGAALAGSRRQRWLSASRVDPRRGRQLGPSPWLLDALSRCVGRTVLASEWSTLDRVEIERVGQRELAPPAPLGLDDLDHHLAAAAAGARVPLTDIDGFRGPIGDAAMLIGARRSERLGEYDGVVGPDLASVPDVVSATRLETWARCPMRYFLTYELGVGEVERPEQVIELSALDRGSLLHEILEKFVSERISGNGRSSDGRSRTEEIQRIEALAVERFESIGRTGVGGRALLWELTQEELLGHLHAWLSVDAELRARFGSETHAVELPIGVGEAAPLAVELPSGRRIGLRGFADRVDRDRHGRPIVFDYKSGRVVSNKALEADPTDGGTHLQLGVYALAVAPDPEDGIASAYYWGLRETDAGKALTGYEFGDSQRRRFIEVVDHIVTRIDLGEFPMHPGAYNDYFATYDNCRTCPFDRLCPIERGHQIDLKQPGPPVPQPDPDHIDA